MYIQCTVAQIYTVGQQKTWHFTFVYRPKGNRCKTEDGAAT